MVKELEQQLQVAKRRTTFVGVDAQSMLLSREIATLFPTKCVYMYMLLFLCFSEPLHKNHREEVAVKAYTDSGVWDLWSRY